jgi:hypothetical protein
MHDDAYPLAQPDVLRQAVPASPHLLARTFSEQFVTNSSCWKMHKDRQYQVQSKVLDKSARSNREFYKNLNSAVISSQECFPFFAIDR